MPKVSKTAKASMVVAVPVIRPSLLLLPAVCLAKAAPNHAP